MLVPLMVAFITGLLCGSALPYAPFSIGILLAVSALSVTWLERSHRMTERQGLIIFGSLMAGVLYWTVSLSLTSGSGLLEVAGQHPVQIIGTVAEPVRHAPNRAVMILDVTGAGEQDGLIPTGGRFRLTWRGPDRVPHQGDRIAATARIRPPSGLINPGGFNYEAYLLDHGITAVASVSGPGQVVVLPAEPGLSRWAPIRFVERWRERVRNAALISLDGSALAIYLGMIIGEPDYVTPELRDLFMATGTVHILSISGSHLGLIAWLSYVFVARLCRLLPASWLLALSRHTTPSRLAAAITIWPVVFYTLLAGAQVATVRSLVMILIFLLAVWLGRANRLPEALAVAALVILLSDPRALFDLSFQLSFLSVLAIALVVSGKSAEESSDYPTVPTWPAKAKSWIIGYLTVTGGITLLTLPLVARHFHQIAWLGMAANFVVIPFAGFLLVPVGLGSAIWLLVSGSETLPAASINQTLGDLLTDAVRMMAQVPNAEWHVASPAIPAMAAFYLLLIVAWRLRRPVVRWGALVAAGLLVIWWAGSPRLSPDGETLRVTFLDVGQGDACLIELPDGQTVLIDGGAAYDTLDMGRAVIGPFLWDRGITRLDHVIGTHPQLDHVGGLAWVAETFPIGHYWGNGVNRDEPLYQRMRAGLAAQAIIEERAEAGYDIIDSGPCRLHVLNPPPAGEIERAVIRRSAGSMLNNASVVTRLDCSAHSFLFTADIEADAIARLHENESFSARVLKVPHHGARSSLQTQWIAHVHPEIAVISVGRTNPYGHPAPIVLQAYESQGSRVLRTDQLGAIQIAARLSSPTMTIQGTRDLLLKPVTIGSNMWCEEYSNLRKLWTRWRGALPDEDDPGARAGAL